MKIHELAMWRLALYRAPGGVLVARLVTGRAHHDRVYRCTEPRRPQLLPTGLRELNLDDFFEGKPAIAAVNAGGARKVLSGGSSSRTNQQETHQEEGGARHPTGTHRGAR